MPPYALEDAAAIFPGGFHEIAAAAILLSRYVAFLTETNLHGQAPRYVAKVMGLSLDAFNSYPDMVGETIDGIQLSPILGDLQLLKRGATPERLARSPLWQYATNTAVILQFPPEPEQLWAFWDQWFSARMRGRETLLLAKTRATSLDHALRRLPNEIWDGQVEALSDQIAATIADHLDDELEESVEDLRNADADQVGAQNPVALQFYARDDNVIDVNVSAGQNRIKNDADAADRHAEVLSGTQDLLGLRTTQGIGANQTARLMQDAERLVEALGSSPSETRPGLLIPRGERLRRHLADQNQVDEIGADPPLPPPFLSALAVLVGAYNVFVAFDPELSRHDEAQLPPEARSNLISPDAGRALVESAVKGGVATLETQAALSEEGALAPIQPNPDNRSSRRYSEGIKNFGRATIALALKSVRWAWSNKGKVTAASAAMISAASWVASHEVVLLEVFSSSPTIMNIISEISKVVRMLS